MAKFKYACEECGKTFKHPGTRNFHIWNIHKHQKKEQAESNLKISPKTPKIQKSEGMTCWYCNNNHIFKFRNDLYGHMRNVHNDLDWKNEFKIRSKGMIPRKPRLKNYDKRHKNNSESITPNTTSILIKFCPHCGGRLPNAIAE